MSDCFVIGIDVGTSSVRGGLFTETGSLMKSHSIPIKIFTPRPEYFEQSSDDIWDAACRCVREITQGVNPESVKGLGFDATCSLVAIGRDGRPVTVSPDLNPQQNVVMWMDHRAGSQAQRINQNDKKYFKSVGGSVSLEMEVPKLLWLKENLPQDCWEKAERFLDLPDFLTWRATGTDSRSLCSVVCKWLYNASPDLQEWNQEFYTKVGIHDLLLNGAAKIGKVVRAPGELCGSLTEGAAKSMGLLPGIAVATSIIDAHAGGIGMIGCTCDGVSQDITRRLSLICGTSTCHMAVSSDPLFCPGVWGPYYSAMVPGLWLNEAGQSAAGKLLDYLVDRHHVAVELRDKLGGNEELVRYLNDLLRQMAARKGTEVDVLTEDVHVWPDFHGNRSPVGDPTLKGMVSGLTLSQDEETFAVLYLAAIQALTYGTQHILEVLKDNGHQLETLLLCGGLSKNPLFVQTHANALTQSILVPERTESVLLGAAMLGATAAKLYPDLHTALGEMAGRAENVRPVQDVLRYHERKYKVFKRMLADQLAYREIMK